MIIEVLLVAYLAVGVAICIYYLRGIPLDSVVAWIIMVGLIVAGPIVHVLIAVCKIVDWLKRNI